MRQLASPAVCLWLTLGLHVLLLVGAIVAGLLLRQKVDPDWLVLPVALAQWALLLVASGLGPFGWLVRLELLVALVVHGSAVRWIVSAMHEEFLLDFPIDTFRERWSWLDREQELLLAGGLFIAFAVLRRWVARIEIAPTAEELSAARPPERVGIRGLIVVTTAGALLVGVLNSLEISGLLMPMFYAPSLSLETQITCSTLALIGWSSLAALSVHDWTAKTALGTLVSAVMAAMAGYLVSNDLSVTFAGVAAGLFVQLLLIASLIFVRSRGWRIRWRGQFWATPWKAPSPRSGRERWKRRLLLAGVAGTGCATLTFVVYAIFVSPNQRRVESVRRIQACGGQVSYLPDTNNFWQDSWTAYCVRRFSSEAYIAKVGSVSLRRCAATDAVLSRLEDLPDILDLNLDSTPINDSKLAYLKNLSALEFLILDRTAITDAALPQLADFTKLRFVSLSETKVTGSTFASLRALPGLVVIHLADTELSDEGLEQLAGMPLLQYLTLRGTKVTDDGLKHISAMPALQNLDLSDTEITDVGAAHLANANGLTSLTLSGTKITDGALTHLAKLPGLRVLSLNNTHVTDAGLEYLTKNSSVSLIHVRQTHVTAAAMQSLESLRPNGLSIDCDSSEHD